MAASAPGRVNLIGEHTDYNGGPVLPVALERRTAVAARAAQRWALVSSTEDEVHADRYRRADAESVDRLSRGRRPGAPGAPCAPPPGAELGVGTNLPIGAGLSSSAALTVAAAKAMSLLAGKRLSPAALAEVAFRAEYHQVGVRCGRMDQTIAAHAERGSALLFETAGGALQPGAISRAALDRGDRGVAPAHRRCPQRAAAGV